jgi:hypothetical protein
VADLGIGLNVADFFFFGWNLMPMAWFGLPPMAFARYHGNITVWTTRLYKVTARGEPDSVELVSPFWLVEASAIGQDTDAGEAVKSFAAQLQPLVQLKLWDPYQLTQPGADR